MPHFLLLGRARLAVLAMACAVFLYGLATVWISPPFEGSDETAHFSRIVSQAYARQNNVSGDATQKDFEPSNNITQDVYLYYRQGPMPYMWIDVDTLHQQDPRKDGFLSYHNFFSQRGLWENYRQLYRDKPLGEGYRAGPEGNWEYQHPPLYYILLAPVLKLLAAHASLVTTLMILRVLSYFLAFTGFMIGFYASVRFLHYKNYPDVESWQLFGLLYPFLCPAFFFNFARISNDCLCLLFFGLIWALMLAHVQAMETEGRDKNEIWMFLGIVMGLSWLAKAIMIPVALGLIIFLAYFHGLVLPKKTKADGSGWFIVIKTSAIVFLTGSPSYLINFLKYKTLGSIELHNIFDANVPEKFLTFKMFIINFAYTLSDMIRTGIFAYGGWSGTQLDTWFVSLSWAVTTMALGGYIMTLFQSRFNFVWLPFVSILPVIVGLIAHIILMIIFLPTNTFTPGYYVHDMAPGIAAIFGFGMLALGRTPGTRRWLILSLGAYAVCFTGLIAISSMALYSGCAEPTILHYTNIAFHRLPMAPVALCLEHMPLVIEHLSIIAWPNLALGAYALTYICLFTVLVIAKPSSVSLNPQDNSQGRAPS